ncbi:Phosphopantetheine adenylyltransferase [Clostridium collagenovorans DSM 3089]|uniref:Phosphopantetheine adenylyltransferase n=1 Tax=Clostridium collagenovorans DSM 3089 TaxID=1121306 RepID=A0A1M5SSX7_9CLOT|nr:pantetheine-phosphate adenylyltransferase [Clostridium collagenovorans]SHH41641.1 Phosphopantetheine adenylyltransferase [Clostridium collagenovorans DSM 3089]
MKKAIYPGSFDPITKGHLDIIRRGSKSFDKVIVAVLINSEKQGLFSIEERVSLIRKATFGIDNVEIISFEGLLVDYMEKNHISIILKGLRNSKDFEYELQMANVNKILGNEIETIFMISNPENSYISSSMVKEVCKLGGNISGLVPSEVESIIKKKIMG